jgi:citrate synthase
MSDKPNFYSNIWLDEGQPENPFVADKSYCAGYDVYGQLLGQASYCDYLLLMFTGEKPAPADSKALELLAMSLANSGPRSGHNRAAMNAGVGAAPGASRLIAALSVGAGQMGGSREVFTLVQWFYKHGLDIEAWLTQCAQPNEDDQPESVWDKYEHVPGFDPHGVRCPKTLETLLTLLSQLPGHKPLVWLQENKPRLESHTGFPITQTFIAAATFFSLGISEDLADMLFLILSLPGAAVHSTEAKQQGWRKFPFFGQNITLTDDPGPKGPIPFSRELPQ